jgi:hypothetical protein
MAEKETRRSGIAGRIDTETYEGHLPDVMLPERRYKYAFLLNVLGHLGDHGSKRDDAALDMIFASLADDATVLVSVYTQDVREAIKKFSSHGGPLGYDVGEGRVFEASERVYELKVHRRGRGRPGAGASAQKAGGRKEKAADARQHEAAEAAESMVPPAVIAGELWKEYRAQTAEASGKISSCEGSGQSLVLYADDIIENALMVDLEETIGNIAAKRNVLTGGKIVLYDRKGGESAKRLEEIIKRAGPNIEVVTVTKTELGIVQDEDKLGGRYAAAEADRVLRYAKGKVGVNNVLAIIRGSARQPEELIDFANNEARLPILIMEEKGAYLLSRAIEIAISMKSGDGASGALKKAWLRTLPPFVPLSVNIKEEYEKGRASMPALVAA